MGVKYNTRILSPKQVIHIKNSEKTLLGQNKRLEHFLDALNTVFSHDLK